MIIENSFDKIILLHPFCILTFCFVSYKYSGHANKNDRINNNNENINKNNNYIKIAAVKISRPSS